MSSPRFLLAAIGLAAATAAATVGAATPADFIKGFEQSARQADPSFAGFSAARGQQFFRTRHSDWACASCHTDDPSAQGKHVVTGRSIAPLAPAANPERFTDAAKVEKWFRRNCNDVVKRACTPQEKGDVLTWLAGVGK